MEKNKNRCPKKRKIKNLGNSDYDEGKEQLEEKQEKGTVELEKQETINQVF